MKLHIKYQRPGLLLSDKKILKVFPYMSLCKTCDPVARPFLTYTKSVKQVTLVAGPVLTQGL